MLEDVELLLLGMKRWLLKRGSGHLLQIFRGVSCLFALTRLFALQTLSNLQVTPSPFACLCFADSP